MAPSTLVVLPLPLYLAARSPSRASVEILRPVVDAVSLALVSKGIPELFLEHGLLFYFRLKGS